MNLLLKEYNAHKFCAEDLDGQIWKVNFFKFVRVWVIWLSKHTLKPEDNLRCFGTHCIGNSLILDNSLYLFLTRASTMV